MALLTALKSKDLMLWGLPDVAVQIMVAADDQIA